MTLIHDILMVALMVFGFGFVVFFHELGHFLAAKWVGIRVEQFAVGFGQALFAWRKGIGWKVGTTTKEYRRRIEAHLDSQKNAVPNADPRGDTTDGYSDLLINKTGDELGLGETEYRLNWIPLGGYVKMLGQDDLKANAGAEDPRAYNRKGVGQRMIVVSAGVIMNIILAAIGFMAVFLIGFTAPPPVIGQVVTNSPAQRAGLQVGDRVITIDGTHQYDFHRIVLSAALLKADADVPVVVDRPNPTNPKLPPERLTLTIRPAQMDSELKGLLGIGIGQSAELRAPTAKEAEADKDFSHLPEYDIVRPGETIVEIAGTPVEKVNQFYLLYNALQKSDGKPVPIVVENDSHLRRTTAITPQLDQVIWGNKPLEFAGMEPCPQVAMVLPGSSAAGKLLAGDVILGVSLIDHEEFTGMQRTKVLFGKAAEDKKKISLTIERDGKIIPPIADLQPHTKLDDSKKRGMGIALGYYTKPIVSHISDKSPAARAKIPSGITITAVDGKPVNNWFAVRSLIATVGTHEITGHVQDEKPATYSLVIDQTDVDSLNRISAMTIAQLQPLQEPRITHNPIEAASWGLAETRDFVLQFYVTLTRMFQGSVPLTSMMGPLGIVTSGARFAFKGMDWLIWFLSMISANLAVVNFLPIPIVDGGLFTFLVLEKLQGKPLSPKVMAVAQIVGFALIISVFLLVTFQDIRRTIGF
jgi:regulator of sigma E protease